MEGRARRIASCSASARAPVFRRGAAAAGPASRDWATEVRRHLGEGISIPLTTRGRRAEHGHAPSDRACAKARKSPRVAARMKTGSLAVKDRKSVVAVLGRPRDIRVPDLADPREYKSYTTNDSHHHNKYSLCLRHVPLIKYLFLSCTAA